jgi:REP element-mobilizing transposase RayT
MRLNAPGMMVENVWQELNTRFPEVKTDACVVMPNHVHGIIWLVGAPLVGALDESILH